MLSPGFLLVLNGCLILGEVILATAAVEMFIKLPLVASKLLFA